MSGALSTSGMMLAPSFDCTFTYPAGAFHGQRPASTAARQRSRIRSDSKSEINMRLVCGNEINVRSLQVSHEPRLICTILGEARKILDDLMPDFMSVLFAEADHLSKWWPIRGAG